MMRVLHAFDRESVRRIDQDGHMHIAASVISAAGVSQYRGSEIPNADALGLRPDGVYHLLRCPFELERAAASFAGKPLTSEHQDQSAADYRREITVGTVGGPVRFDGRKLRAPLVVWDAAAIRAIETGEKSALSCGYLYRAVPRSGTFAGQTYTHVMRDISGNHVTLCRRGRVPGAVVGDVVMRKRAMPEYEADFDQFTKINRFMAERLNPDDQATFEGLLAELVAELTGEQAPMAADAARRNVRMRARVAADAGFADRFPKARGLYR